MIITFTGAGPMRGQVQCVGGGDGPYYGTGNTFSIPATGECQITVGANTMADNWTGGFTLAILVNWAAFGGEKTHTYPPKGAPRVPNWSAIRQGTMTAL